MVLKPNIVIILAKVVESLGIIYQLKYQKIVIKDYLKGYFEQC